MTSKQKSIVREAFIITNPEESSEKSSDGEERSTEDLQSINRKLVTENAQLQARIRELDEELAAANKELESFSNSVSHDLRSPIRAMSGFSAILLEDYADKLDHNGLEFLQRIVNGAEKANNLIDDMLNLLKITRQELILQEVDLRSLIASTIEELRRSEPRRRVKVMVGGDMKTRGDKRLLTIALSNLIGNAWKYTGKIDEASVEIGVLNKDGSGRVFFVKDNGAGFNMANVGKLFQPFQRLHRENQFPGTGIGLAIVDRIIRKHGGKVWAEAQEGKGATFYFTLGGTEL